MGRMTICVILICAGRIATASDDKLGSGAMTAAAVLDRAIETIEHVSAMSVEYTVRSSPGSRSEGDPEVERDANGHAISHFVRFWWDVRGLYRLEVREWQPAENRPNLGGRVYDQYTYTLDGEMYRGASSASKRGKIRAQAELENGHVTPLTFLGYDICGVGRSHLCRVLRDHGDVADHVDVLPGGLLQLTAEFDPPDGSYRLGVKLGIDPQQEYRPVSIEATYLWSNTRAMDVTVEKTEIVSGVRIPTAGRVASYYINEINPDGLTNGDVNAMTKEEYFAKIKPRVRHEAVLTGPAMDATFDSTRMTVNEICPMTFFQLEIPADYQVADFSESRLVAVDSGSETDPKPKTINPGSVERDRRLRVTSVGVNPWIIFGGVNALAIGAIAGVRAWRRTVKRKRFAAALDREMQQ